MGQSEGKIVKIRAGGGRKKGGGGASNRWSGNGEKKL
jgi:uncharacterized membrane protein YgcG